MKWKAGDLFFKPWAATVIYRVHRVKGTTIYYLPKHYGCNPPKGSIRNAQKVEAGSWVKVERNYASK